MNSCYSYMLLICSVILLLPNCLGQKDQDNTSTIGASNTTLQAYPINTTTQLEVLDDKIFGGLGNRGKRAQRKTDSKKSKSKSAGKTRTSAPDDEHPENEKKENNHKTKGDDDNYHVRYETKFAFQNIDEFGLKVKYNKTEHVFYGDTIANGTAPGSPQSPAAPQENDVCVDPAGRTYTVGQLNSSPGECSLRVCEPGGIFSIRNTCTYPTGTAPCAPDLSLTFPECCECPTETYGYPYVQDGFRPFDGSLSPLVGEDSLEMIECRKMNFLDNEYEKPIEGMCIMCYRGQGTYRYIQGCQRMDCDAFMPTDPTAPYPDCCPACVGERYIFPETTSEATNAPTLPVETNEQSRMMNYATSDELNEDELISETGPGQHATDKAPNEPMEPTTRDEVPEESQMGAMTYIIDPNHERKFKNMRETRRRKLF